MWQTLQNQLLQYCNSVGINLTHSNITNLYTDYNSIDALYNATLQNLSVINYIMLAEAPFGSSSYFYNLAFPNQSNFFFAKNMKDALHIKGIKPYTNLITKQDLVTELLLRGFLIIDISPFALNKTTNINYTSLSKGNYQRLIQPTLTTFFNSRLQQIQPQLNPNEEGIKVFYRYRRIETHLGNTISSILSNYGMQILPPPLNVISKRGFSNIDVNKLASIL